MADLTITQGNKESNYDKFKRDALVRFLTYDQGDVIRRLNLDHDDAYIYLTFCSREYRINRHMPAMEHKDKNSWVESNSNAVLTICDLLCHTEAPILLSGTYTTLEGLNRVKAGTSKTTLGEKFYGSTERYYDENSKKLAKACESLGGVKMGKGDVAYRIPIFGPIALQISFYESDDEFPAQLTFFLDKAIDQYLFYETLWYMIGLILEEIKQLMEEIEEV